MCWCKTTPNIHTPASLYEAFEPAEAKRLAGRLELHSTPKHGSWLNMAEIELAVLAGQCLDRRLADRATLEREVAAWQTTRNATGRGVDWRFTTQDSRGSSSSTSTLQFRTDKLLGHHRHAPPWSRSRPAVWPSTTATAMATVVGGGLGSSVRSCQPCRSASTASSLPIRGSTARRL